MAASAGGAGKGPKGWPPSDQWKEISSKAKESSSSWWMNTTKWWEGATKESKSALEGASAKLSHAAKDIKTFSMTVDTKVDFITPTLESARNTSHTIWNNIPPPLQSRISQDWPYAAVGVGSSSATSMYLHRSWKNKEAKYNEALGNLMEHKSQLEEKLQRSETRETKLEENYRVLQHKYDQMKIDENKPNPQVIAMTKQVAEATKAAAQAATAAAQASSRCIRVPPNTNE